MALPFQGAAHTTTIQTCLWQCPKQWCVVKSARKKGKQERYRIEQEGKQKTKEGKNVTSTRPTSWISMYTPNKLDLPWTSHIFSCIKVFLVSWFPDVNVLACVWCVEYSWWGSCNLQTASRVLNVCVPHVAGVCFWARASPHAPHPTQAH